MAGELQLAHATAKTVYAQVRTTTGTIWNTAGTPAFQAYSTANIADYDIALTEQGTASGYYIGTFPTGITTPGQYNVTYLERAGGSPAETDIKLATEAIQWSGTAVVPLHNAPVNVNQLNGTAWLSTALGKIYGSLASDTVTDASTMPTNQTFDAASLSNTNSNFYRGKKILWTSGNNAGLTSTISASSWGGTYNSITLAVALPATVAAPDAFVLLPESSESNPVMWGNGFVSASLFTGITTLAQWLGLLAGKQSGNSTARTEIRATGAGSGTFDETTDSLQAIRDQGDSAWTGGGGLDAAGVRAAVGLASANLDTQLSAIDDYLDTEVAAIKAKTDNLPSDPADASDIAAAFSTVNGTLSTIAGYVDSEVAAIKAKTDQMVFTTANRLDVQVHGMEANTLTASALATDAVNEINSASNPLVLQTTTIATLASQVSFTLTAGSADNGAYNGCLVIVTDASTATQKAKGVVLQYVGASKTVRLAFDPSVFTMAAGDTVSIMAANQTPVIHAEMSVKSTAGTTAQLTAWMEVAGTRVPIATIDAAATCSFVVREHGSGSNLFTASGVAADITNSMFEIEQASPAFTDDRQYELTATITLNSVAYSTTHSRVVIG